MPQDTPVPDFAIPESIPTTHAKRGTTRFRVTVKEHIEGESDSDIEAFFVGWTEREGKPYRTDGEESPGDAVAEALKWLLLDVLPEWYGGTVDVVVNVVNQTWPPADAFNIPDTVAPPCLNIQESAAALGTNRRRIWQLIHDGELRTIPNPLDHRQKLISRADVDRLNLRAKDRP